MILASPLGKAQISQTAQPDDRAVTTATVPSVRSKSAGKVAPLLLAPDRGFLGNEEVRDAWEAFAQGTPGDVVFVTDERTRDSLNQAMRRLAEAGVREVVALPLFLSAWDPRFVLARQVLAEWPKSASASAAPSITLGPVSLGRIFGQSYLAVEVLADRFRAIRNPAGREVIVIGHGAKDAESRRRMESDWQRLAELAADGFGFKSVRALVWYDSSKPENRDQQQEAESALAEAGKTGERVAVVPFHFGKKLDSMMTFSAGLRHRLPQDAEWIEGEVTPHPAVATWIAREFNRRLPLQADDLGVVFLAHGSDFHWNETMRQAVDSLAKRYKIEFAFCMADPPLVERAVRKLEQRGARAIVIVRVFGLAASFERDVERMIGLDVEKALLAAADAGGGSNAGEHAHHQHDAVQGGHAGHAHHGHVAGPPGPRIRSSALFSTAGGLEDHPFFAEALLDRAKALSNSPERETVILVAHGAGDDPTNDHWRQILQSLAARMRTNGGAAFRDIRVGTWREDWPEQRAPEVTAIRRMVEQASRDGGRAIVIPARTAAQGDEREFLKGLDFELGRGFAPHPLFARWVEEKIREGLEAFASALPSSDATAHAAHAGGGAGSAPQAHSHHEHSTQAVPGHKHQH